MKWTNNEIKVTTYYILAMDWYNTVLIFNPANPSTFVLLQAILHQYITFMGNSALPNTFQFIS